MTTRKIPLEVATALSHSDYWCLQARERAWRRDGLRPPRPGKTCSPRRMNMTGAPPATESGKPGCPLLGKVRPIFIIFKTPFAKFL